MIPFFGLSIIIHSVIIIAVRSYKKFNLRLSLNFLENKRTSYLIVSFITMIVMVNAYLLIKTSIKNSPNLKIIENSFSNEEAIAGSSSNINSNETVPNNESKLLLSLRANSEKKEYLSIIDFLDSIGIDSSFKNRYLIAKNFGINNYIGSAEQNIKLLSVLQN